MRYSTHIRTSEKNRKRTHSFALLSAQISQRGWRFGGRKRAAIYKIMGNVPKMIPANILQENRPPEKGLMPVFKGMEKGAAVFAQRGELASSEKVNKKRGNNAIFHSSCFGKTLTCASDLNPWLKKPKFHRTLLCLLICLSLTRVFATDYQSQARDLIGDSHSQMNSSLQQAEEVAQMLGESLAHEIPPGEFPQVTEKNKDESTDPWGETEGVPLTTARVIKNSPLQKEGETCCKVPVNFDRKALSLTDEKIPDTGQGEYLIFVSFSMPDQALKNLYEESLHLKARLVLRGLYENSFQETKKKIEQVGIQADIDPTLFEKHAIQVVPTFVSTKKNQTDRVCGNITAHEALEIFRGDNR